MPRSKNPWKDASRSIAADAGDEDGDLFRRAMADARPLRRDTIEPPRQRARAVARFSRQDERQVLRESLAADVETMEIQNGSGLAYRHPSVNLKTMRKLARGSYSVQGEIDLHGMTSAEAKEVLRQFIQDSLLRGATCVRIVHGKGLRSGRNGPVLKRMVDSSLRRWDAVLAFASARQAHGGTGALYVLLKKTS